MRGRSAVAAAVAALATVLSLLTPSGRAAAQDASGPAAAPVEVAAVSPWVDPDGSFQVRFAPTTAVPATDVLTWTVHQRLRPAGDEGLRDAVDAVLDGGRPGPVLRPATEVPVGELGDPAQGLVLDVPVRSARDGSDRVLLPTAGIHPVTLRLRAADGAERWSEVVFLNRLPAGPVVGSDDRPGVVSVSLVLPLESAPTVAPGGDVVLPVPDRAVVASAVRLLAEVPTAPLWLAVRPNLLDGLVRSDEPADERAVTVLRSATAASPVRQTYVQVDTAALAQAGAGDLITSESRLGDRVSEAALGRAPVGSTWWLDDTVSAASLPALRRLGTERLVVSPDRLRLPSGTGTPTVTTRTAALEGSGLAVVATDGELTLRLVSSGRSPGVRAHAVVTDLMASWFDAAAAPGRSFPGPASAIVVPPQTDAPALRALAAALEAGGPLTTDPDRVPLTAAEVDGRPLVATLAPRSVPDESRAVAARRDTDQLVAGYRSMSGTADPALALWEVLSAQALSVRADPGARASYHQTVRDEVAERVGAITVPPPRRVVLTGRSAEIPLRFRNGLPFPVRVDLGVRSPRLDVRGPDRRVVELAPGENLVELPVVVRAPGESLLRLEVTSPDGVITLPTRPVPVAATTISGVGAALSVLSLLVLAGWWLLTHRRTRRDRARHGHPAAEPGPAAPTPARTPAADPPADRPGGRGPPSATATAATAAPVAPPADRPTAEVPAVEVDRG